MNQPMGSTSSRRILSGASMVACSSSEKANDAENAAEAPEVVEETVEAVEAVDTVAGDTIVAVVDSVAVNN